ncbi:MAG: gliding motility protein GldL [Prevotellaceae bacterium]|jgi:gliding motility-associated protein GldL|nr:gliding motility protein GldL [Prevotellaceae bacterium]
MSFFETKQGKKLMAFAYGAGASVVILGALFKILHLPGANLMLMAGMGVEAVIFLISAFEPVPVEYHWDNVYPELLAEHTDHSASRTTSRLHQAQSQANLNFDLSIDKSTTDDLKTGIKKFSESISQMSNMASLVDATSELTGKMHAASGSVTAISESAHTLSDAYFKGAQTIQHINEQSRSGLEQLHSGYEFYRGQLESMGRTMGALNSSYELYLQETQKVQNDYLTLHGELQQLVGNVNISISETQKLGTQMAGLNNNVENLNSIYGSMLTAVNSVLNK